MATERSLEGRIAFVTGAGRGIGRAMALELAERGAAVAAVARSSAQIDQTRDDIVAAGGRAISVTCDVADPASVAAAVATVDDAYGPVDVLVNNAATNQVFGPLWEVDADRWWAEMAINLRGPMLCAAAVLPSMVARGQGCIVNVVSGAAKGPFPYNASYAMAKAGLVRMTDTLAAEAGPHGVKVFALSPGAIDTDMCRSLMASPEAQQWIPETVERLPSIFISPTVPAEAVAFIAEGRADALSGRWLEAFDDLPAIVARADEVAAENLFTLRMDR
jgi:NAD(P)-dependent dehydrogenase (short-subunit alcohol dehydrogenase family)